MFHLRLQLLGSAARAVMKRGLPERGGIQSLQPILPSDLCTSCRPAAGRCRNSTKEAEPNRSGKQWVLDDANNAALQPVSQRVCERACHRGPAVHRARAGGRAAGHSPSVSCAHRLCLSAPRCRCCWGSQRRAWAMAAAALAISCSFGTGAAKTFWPCLSQSGRISSRYRSARGTGAPAAGAALQEAGSCSSAVHRNGC